MQVLALYRSGKFCAISNIGSILTSSIQYTISLYVRLYLDNVMRQGRRLAKNGT